MYALIVDQSSRRRQVSYGGRFVITEEAILCILCARLLAGCLYIEIKELARFARPEVKGRSSPSSHSLVTNKNHTYTTQSNITR